MIIAIQRPTDINTGPNKADKIQRDLKFRYILAGRNVDQLEAAGILGSFEGSKARRVLVANEVALEAI